MNYEKLRGGPGKDGTSNQAGIQEGAPTSTTKVLSERVTASPVGKITRTVSSMEATSSHVQVRDPGRTFGVSFSVPRGFPRLETKLLFLKGMDYFQTKFTNWVWWQEDSFHTWLIDYVAEGKHAACFRSRLLIVAGRDDTDRSTEPCIIVGWRRARINEFTQVANCGRWAGCNCCSDLS